MRKLCILWLVITFSLSLLAREGDAQKGLEIARRSEKANEGFKGEKSSMVMRITNARGESVERQMSGKTLEILGQTLKKLLLFQTPHDIRGTKMLTWAHKKKEDDQWLYLPSLKRVKRITSSGRSASFMGSEFSYEDLGSQSIEKNEYYFIKEDTLDGERVWILDSYPKSKSGYTKQRIWMSQKYLNAIKIHYFNRRKEHFKSAVFENFKKFTVADKDLYRSQKVTMKNHQTNKSSEFMWKDLQLGVSLSEREFHQRELAK